MGARGTQALSRANRIGDYEILGLLGSSVTAAVYECRHAKLASLVIPPKQEVGTNGSPILE